MILRNNIIYSNRIIYSNSIIPHIKSHCLHEQILSLQPPFFTTKNPLKENSIYLLSKDFSIQINIKLLCQLIISILFLIYLFASSRVISSQVTPLSAINTIMWYRKSEISYFTSSGSGFLAAITISVASSPSFFRILSIPLSNR